MEVTRYRLARNIPLGMKPAADERGGPALGALEAGFERVEDLDDLFPTTRTHVRILTKPADGNRPTNPRLWINVQLWIHRMLTCRPG